MDSTAHRRVALARLIDRQLATMTDTATITHPGDEVSDGSGGAVAGEPTTQTVPCRLAPAGTQPEERQIGAMLQGVLGWVIAMPLGTTIGRADTIVIAGRTFDVIGVLGPHTEEVERRVVAREIT